MTNGGGSKLAPVPERVKLCAQKAMVFPVLGGFWDAWSRSVPKKGIILNFEQAPA
jgi:hypothetical protein